MFIQIGTLLVLALGFILGYVFCQNESTRSEIKDQLYKLHVELRKDNDGE